MVLITGATGFIGSRLVHHLLTLTEQSLYVLTRWKQKQHHLLKHERINVITGDISEKFVLPKDITSIYHCAGIISKKEEMWKVNVEGTRNIAEVALRQRCRLIHLSSAGVVGANSRSHINESAECKPQNIYERTKWEAEKIIKGYVEKGLRAQIVRPTIVIGPGRDHDQDSFFQLIRSIKNGRYVNIDGGSGIYNIIHVDEVAGAMKALDNDRVPNGETFFVNTPISYKELSEIIVEETGARKRQTRNVPYCMALTLTMMMSAVTLATGKKMPLTYSRLRALVNQKMFSQDKLYEMTGYEPAMPIQQYVRQMYHVFAEKGWLDN